MQQAVRRTSVAPGVHGLRYLLSATSPVNQQRVGVPDARRCLPSWIAGSDSNRWMWIFAQPCSWSGNDTEHIRQEEATCLACRKQHSRWPRTRGC